MDFSCVLAVLSANFNLGNFLSYAVSLVLDCLILHRMILWVLLWPMANTNHKAICMITEFLESYI